MILDQITLAGLDAYLRGADANQCNIASFQPETIPNVGSVRRARSLPVGEGMLVQVSAVQLYLERSSFADLLQRHGSAWITLRVEKEMFPGLYRNPYAHRTHRLAGFEDFSRGHMTNLRVMEVDDVATLVSTGADDQCTWQSAIYTMPAKLPFNAVAWEIPTHKDSPASSLSYDLDLLTWMTDPATTTPTVKHLVSGANPNTPRFAEFVQPLGARYYQFEFRVTVRHDAPLHEQHIAEVTNESLGRPVLTGIYLLESVANAFEFRSLPELMGQSAGYELFDHTTSPQRVVATLEFSATLAKNESIVLDLSPTTPPLSVLEARMTARVTLRPPRTELRR